MRASLSVAWAEVRRRRLQSAVIVVMVALASGTVTLGLNLLQQAGNPYDRAFEARRGAHLKVFYDAQRVTPGQLASTPASIGASSSAGPWPDVYLTVRHRRSPDAGGDGGSRSQLDLVGRDGPEGTVEVLRMTSGRWARSPGEVVVNRGFATANRVNLGDRLVSLHTADKPALTVVGVAVDVGQTAAGGSIATTQRGWVLPAQVADLAGGSGLGYEMAYRFPSAPSQAQLQDVMGRLQRSLPPAAVTGSLNHLAMRDAYNITNQFVLSLLLAFGVIALAASLAAIVNLVIGTVLAGYREIGISKALGFTPFEVVASLVVGMALPALAGCALGIPAGAVLSLPLIDRAARGLDLPSDAAVSPITVVLALAAILLGVVLAAAVPALRAGRMSAVAAIAAGGAPRPPLAWRPSRPLQRLRLPRPLSLGTSDAFIRPLRGGLTMLAVLIGVATIVFAFGLREAFAEYPRAASRLNGDVSVARERTVSDGRVMAILGGQPQTRQVVAVATRPVVVPGLADPVDAVAFRDDPRGLGWSDFLVRGRWPGERPGEVLLRQSVLDQAHLDVGSSFDAVIAGRPVRLDVVGEIASLDADAVLTWPTLTTAEPDAQPGRYAVQLRPGADADGFAAAVAAQEPDALTVAVNRASDSADANAIKTVMSILALILALVAAVGVFSTMLLHVRERSRDIAILKALGMSPGQLLAMIMTTSAVLGVIGGLVGMPAGVRAYHFLMPQLAKATGSRLPPFALDVLDPTTLSLLALTGLAIALAGAVLPARRAARSPAAAVLRAE